MTTRIDPTGPSPILDSTPTAIRTTATPTNPFQSMMNAGAGAVVTGAEAAVSKLPGGAVLAAAIRPTPTAVFPGVSSFPGAAPTPTPQTPEGYPATSASTPAAPTSTTTSDPSMENLLSQDANQNLYYLALQERMSAENRFYTAYSDVLRVRHDSMKNAIGNLR